MAGFGGIRKGRKEAADNLSIQEDGECARCGGESQPSTMEGYLVCTRCSYEWADPNFISKKVLGPPPNHRRDSELIEEFKNEMERGDLKGVLGVDSDLSEEQEQSLQRLEDKWMSGMQGHYNAASEDRKPLMISFDDEDNLVSTEVAALTIVSNGFDGGEEIRLEYPGIGTEFYAYNERSPTGWKRGRNSEETARSITNVINRSSRLVYANLEGNRISFELRDGKLKPESLVLFVDDPGGQDIVAEKGGVILDFRDVNVLDDYRNVIALVLEDGIISPSEDQMMWVMRQHIGVTEEQHVSLVQEIFGSNALKECPNCNQLAELYPEYSAWYCQPCESWL